MKEVIYFSIILCTVLLSSFRKLISSGDVDFFVRVVAVFSAVHDLDRMIAFEIDLTKQMPCFDRKQW